MKIVHIIGYIQPEMGYEEHYTAKWQAKLGHDVHVVTSDRIYPFKGKSKKERYRGTGVFNHSGYTIHRLKTLLELPNELIFVQKLFKTIKDLTPDLLYIHEGRSPMQFLASYYAKRNNILYVADHHQYKIDSLKYLKQNNILRYYVLSFIRNSQENTIRRFMNKYVYNNSIMVLPVSEGCKIDLVERLKIPEDKTYQTPLSVDADIFYYSKEYRAKVRKAFHIGDSCILIIQVAGSYHKLKRINLYAELLENDSLAKFKLLIVGAKEYLNELRQHKFFNKRILFVESQPSNELYKYYSAADIAVWISHRSVSILEAMSCQLPIVIPNFGGEKGFIQNNGYLIDDSQMNQLVKNLVDFEKLPAERKYEMGLNSRKLILSNYSYKYNVKENLDIISKLLRN